MFLRNASLSGEKHNKRLVPGGLNLYMASVSHTTPETHVMITSQHLLSGLILPTGVFLKNKKK